MTVALFYLRRDFGGGATSFTVHLYEGMRRAGLDPKIYRLSSRGEARERPFAKYEGVRYRNINRVEAETIVTSVPSVMVAPVHSKDIPFWTNAIADLAKAGMRIVTHDPNEFKVYDHLGSIGKIEPLICIRPTMRKFFPTAVFIPHPYVREFPSNSAPDHKYRDLLAVSVARTTFVKRTAMIVEANSLLRKEDRVVLRGAVNRMYEHHVLLKKWPRHYKPGQGGFPLTWGASARECARAKFAVDLTYFPDDGGGSQYSFMEAWDAGTVNVIHKDWLRYEGEMRSNLNCVAVDGVEGLVSALRYGRQNDVSSIVDAGYKALKKHDAEQVARAYYEEITK